MIPLLLRRRIVALEPGQWDLDNRDGLALVEDKGVRIRNHPYKRAYQVIATSGQQVIELAQHLHIGRLQTDLFGAFTQRRVLQGGVVGFMTATGESNLSTVVQYRVRTL